jgi:hypothetical protein
LYVFQILKQAGAIGEGRAMTSRELMRRTGLTRRELVRRVNRERKRHLICSTTSGDGGYYRPINRADIQRFLDGQEQLIKRHAVSMRLARRLMRRPSNN